MEGVEGWEGREGLYRYAGTATKSRVKLEGEVGAGGKVGGKEQMEEEEEEGVYLDYSLQYHRRFLVTLEAGRPGGGPGEGH